MISYNFNREEFMKKNEGKIDRVLRVAVRASLISFVFWGPETNLAISV